MASTAAVWKTRPKRLRYEPMCAQLVAVQVVQSQEADILRAVDDVMAK